MIGAVIPFVQAVLLPVRLLGPIHRVVILLGHLGLWSLRTGVGQAIQHSSHGKWATHLVQVCLLRFSLNVKCS